VKHDFQPHGLTLRIVAPLAIERTSFEKNRGADAGPVVKRKPLYVENYSRVRVDHVVIIAWIP
jgi:hypothetical protein